MEYLTIEEKASLTGYFVLIDEHIKKCQSLGVSAEYWEKQKDNFSQLEIKLNNTIPHPLQKK